jgi:hypothetical protein
LHHWYANKASLEALKRKSQGMDEMAMKMDTISLSLVDEPEKTMDVLRNHTI